MVGIADQSPRHALLQRLDRYVERCALRLANQQVNMIGHYNVAIDEKAVSASYAFERGFEGMLRCVHDERRMAVVAAEGDEVSLAGLVKALESPGHTAV